MTDEGRRVVIDVPFELTLDEVTRALRAEGLSILSRTDVSGHFRTALRHEFRQYVLLDAWAPAVAFESLRTDLDRGPTLPIRFAVYELADGETAVTAGDRDATAARILGRLRRLPRATAA